MLFLLSIISLLASPTRGSRDGSFCEERWRCQFAHDDSAGTTWRWDLSQLCRANGTYSYSGPGTTGQTFNFNICVCKMNSTQG